MTDSGWRDPVTYWLIVFASFLAIVSMLALTSPAEQPELIAVSTPAARVQDVTEVTEPVIALPVAAASVTTPAVRGEAFQATDTLPPPPVPLTPRQIVNALPYAYTHAGPALEAFAIVAGVHGWPTAKIKAWLPFASDVMAGESGYCWNLLRGAIVAGTDSCEIQTQGTHDDAGFAQLTSVHHGPRGWLCVDHGVCGRRAVIADPWTSMRSFVLLLEREGSQPWCWSDWARRFHNCRLAPDR